MFPYAKHSNCEMYATISKENLFIDDIFFSFNSLPLLGVVLRDKPSGSWIEEKMTSFTHQLKNASMSPTSEMTIIDNSLFSLD